MDYNLTFMCKPRNISAVVLYLLGLHTILTSQLACADDKDTLNFTAGVSRQSDNNLFRTSVEEQSDTITTSYAGIRLDKMYSLQRFKADFTVTDYKYQRNDFLDFKSKDYNAAWLWSVTPYLTGTLSADRKQQLNDFKDISNTTNQNIRTNETQHFDLDWSPHGNWHLLGGFTRADQTNSRVFNAESDSTINALDAGLKYSYPSGSAATIMMHDRSGQYNKRKLDTVNLYDTGFDETEVEAKLDWILSGKSKVSVNLAHVNRVHNHFSRRDYSGEQGRLDYTWTPTGKLQLVTSISSKLASFQTAENSYTRTDTISLSPIYSITSKITAKASISASERSFLGDGRFLSTGRVDKEKMALLSVDWAPYRSVSVGANLRRSSRNSNQSALLDFTDTSAGLSVSLYF